MANELIKQNYRNIADAIRAKTGENGTMTAEEMPGKIENDLAKKPEGSLSITENGDNIDVSDKATVDVNVPTPTFEPDSIYLTDNNGELVDNEEAESGRIYWEHSGELHAQGNFYNNDLYRYAGTDNDYAFSKYDFPYSSSNLYFYTGECDPLLGVDISKGDLCVYKGYGEFASAGSLSGDTNSVLVYWDAGSGTLRKEEFQTLKEVSDEVTVTLEGIGTVKITLVK